jgi:hypothetical protein
MQKPALLFLLCLMSIFTFSCVDDNTDIAPGTANSITVKIDGTAWSAASVSATYSSQSGFTLLTGANSAMTQQLKLAFAGSDVGTYTFTSADQNTFGSFMVTAANVFLFTTLSLDNPEGQIVVTENDKTNHTLSGTFHFDGYSGSVKRTFTEGTFTKVKYGVN